RLREHFTAERRPAKDGPSEASPRASAVPRLLEEPVGERRALGRSPRVGARRTPPAAPELPEQQRRSHLHEADEGTGAVAEVESREHGGQDRRDEEAPASECEKDGGGGYGRRVRDRPG